MAGALPVRSRGLRTRHPVAWPAHLLASAFALTLGALAQAQPEPADATPPLAEAPEETPPLAEPLRVTPPEPAQAPAPSVPDVASGKNPNRTVRGHQFIFPAYVESAFVATYVGLRLQVANLDMPNLPTAFGDIHVSALNIAENLETALKITDWLGLYANFNARTLVSTSVKALVYEGASLGYGANGGVVARLFRNEDSGTQLSLRGSFGATNASVSSLAALFATDTSNISLADAVNTEALRTPIHGTNFRGSIAVAQSLSPMFGLQAAFGLGWSHTTVEAFDIAAGRRVDRSIRGLNYHAGIAASCDFMPLRVPIALMAEYRLGRQPSAPETVGTSELALIQTLYGGVYYSGRPNLQLGLAAGAQLGLPRGETRNGQSERPRLLLGQFVLRYVW